MYGLPTVPAARNAATAANTGHNVTHGHEPSRWFHLVAAVGDRTAPPLDGLRLHASWMAVVASVHPRQSRVGSPTDHFHRAAAMGHAS